MWRNPSRPPRRAGRRLVVAVVGVDELVDRREVARVEHVGVESRDEVLVGGRHAVPPGRRSCRDCSKDCTNENPSRDRGRARTGAQARGRAQETRRRIRAAASTPLPARRLRGHHDECDRACGRGGSARSTSPSRRRRPCWARSSRWRSAAATRTPRSPTATPGRRCSPRPAIRSCPGSRRRSRRSSPAPRRSSRSRRPPPRATRSSRRNASADSATSARTIATSPLALARAGVLAEGVTPEDAADTIYALAGHDVYLRLTHECGWSGARYAAWLLDTLGQSLTSASAGTRPWSTSATSKAAGRSS